MNQTNPTRRTRPVLGAALAIEHLEAHRDWLLEAPRDLEIKNAVRPEVLDGDWKPLVRQARELLTGHGGRLGIHAPFDGLHLASSDPAVRTLVASRYTAALEFAAELGASHMVVHSPFLFFGHPQLVHTPTNGLAALIVQAQATLERVIPLAERLGCTLVIENILDTNPGPLLTLVASLGSPRVRASLDTGHAFITHQLGGPTPDQWVRDAGVLLEHVHLQDNDGQLDRHWPPGDGDVNWRALFGALGELEQSPRLILEVQPGDLRRGVAHLTGVGLAT